MKQFFALAAIAVVARGQEPQYFDLGPVTLQVTDREPRVEIMWSKSNHTYQSKTGKRLELDLAGAVVRDDGLTRDELIQLMHEITVVFIESQKVRETQHEAVDRARDRRQARRW